MKLKAFVFLFLILSLLMHAAPEQSRTATTVYVPYENIEKVFNDKNKGVFIPYQEFIKLWQAGTTCETGVIEPPPVDAVFTRAEYRGTVKGAQAEFSAQISFSVLKKGWSMLECPFSQVALTGLTEKNGRIMLTSRNGKLLIVCEKPGTYELTVNFLAPVNARKDGGEVAFSIPQCAVSRLELTVPERDIDFEVQPVNTGTVTARGASTVLEAHLGMSPGIAVLWKGRKDTHAEAVISCNQERSIFIDQDRVRSQSTLNYHVHQGGTDRVTVLLPEGENVLSLRGDGIKGQKTVNKGRGLELSVTFFSVLDADFSIVLETEGPGGEKIRILPLSTENCMREEGTLIVFRNQEIKCKVENSSGLSRIDASGSSEGVYLPSYGFSFTAPDWLLEVGTEVIQPQILVTQNIEIFLKESDIEVRDTFDLKIRNAGVYSVTVAYPSGLSLSKIEPESDIEDYLVSKGSGQNEAKITFREKAFNDRKFIVTFHQAAPEPYTAYSIPDILLLESDKESGFISVSAPDGFVLNTGDFKALIPYDIQKLIPQMTRSSQAQNQDLKPVLGFRFFTHPYRGTLTITMRESSVSAVSSMLVSVDQNQCAVKGVIDYNIQYAGVTSLSLTVSAVHKGKFRVDGSFINEKKETEKDGLLICDIIFQRPVKGLYSLNWSLEIPIETGKDPKNLVVPCVAVKGAFSVSGRIGIARDQSLNIDSDTDQLEETDVKELTHPLFALSPVFKSFRHVTPEYRLDLTVNRPEYEAVPDCLVKYARLITVYTEDRKPKNMYTLYIQNNGRQFIHLKLPDNFRILSLDINGSSERFSKPDADGYTAIKIPPQSERIFSVLTLQYSTEGHGSMGLIGFGTLRTPEIRDIIVDRLDWHFYLPDRFSYLYIGGNAVREKYSRYAYESEYGRKIREQSMQVMQASMDTSGRHFHVTRLGSWAKGWFFFMSGKLFNFLTGVLFLAVTWYLYHQASRVRICVAVFLSCLLVTNFFDPWFDRIANLFSALQLSAFLVIFADFGLRILNLIRERRVGNEAGKPDKGNGQGA
ncbi:MAG: hypothetical protein PHQ23_00930 [Candidatus Wallbacteria bacterium]|nr:hypothetical protein [Candidatus Wallbacteria bacterium]